MKAVEKELNSKISDILSKSKIKNISLDEYLYSEGKKADRKYLHEKLYPLLDCKEIYNRLRAIDTRNFDKLLQLIKLCTPFTEITNITEITTCNYIEK